MLYGDTENFWKTEENFMQSLGVQMGKGDNAYVHASWKPYGEQGTDYLYLHFP